jgi:hypothetical protein
VPQLIEITFEERPDDETLVHRVRNFGEDLCRLFRTGNRARIDLAAVDAATTRLELVLVDPKHRADVMAAIAKTIEEHYFTGIAHVSERRCDEILTKRCSQPLAVPMSSFHMTATLNFLAKLALAGGG